MMEEFYNSIGGDYKSAKERMMSDTLIEKFIRKFPADPSFQELSDAFQKRELEEMFEKAHTLKGVVLNLSLERLGKATVELTDSLRSQNRDGYEMKAFEDLFEMVRQEYVIVIEAIKKL